MAIFKNTNKYFSAVDSRGILQRTLSFTALGVLADFLNRPRTWKIRLSEITQSLRLPAEEAAAILSELTEKGFAVERRDPYGVYYDIYAYPLQASCASDNRRTAGETATRDGASVTKLQRSGKDVPGAPHRDAPQSRDGQCPSADPGGTAAAQQSVSDAPEKSCGMTDEQRAASLELIHKLFPPTKDYKSPYRD